MTKRVAAANDNFILMDLVKVIEKEKTSPFYSGGWRDNIPFLVILKCPLYSGVGVMIDLFW